jgi:hypothetical protein
MPRPLRPIGDGLVYHVINRGNNRQEVFHKPADFQAFLAARAKKGSELFVWNKKGHSGMPRRKALSHCRSKTCFSSWRGRFISGYCLGRRLTTRGSNRPNCRGLSIRLPFHAR